jgi:hypothetical protein
MLCVDFIKPFNHIRGVNMNTKIPDNNVDLDLAVYYLHLAEKQLENASEYIHHHNSNVKLKNIKKMKTNLLTQIESDELKYYHKVDKGEKHTKNCSRMNGLEQIIIQAWMEE